jgi:hypothetical protein
MDPIHPIIPQQPTITPVTPAPMGGRIDRDTPRNADLNRKRRRRPPTEIVGHDGVISDLVDYEEYDDTRHDDDGGEGLHVDVTA